MPRENEEAMVPAYEYCSKFAEVYKVEALIEQETDSILLSDYQQCIYNYFCEEQCEETNFWEYEVQAYGNSLANTPLITSVNVEVGDYLEVTVDATDTWTAGAGDRTSNADGLTATNPYG